MSAEIGFVYVLGNEKMPGIFKIGCTERSPRERAAELSKASGVPVPFDLLMFIEVRDFQAVERQLHQWLGEYRVSPDREFFECSLKFLVAVLYFHPNRLSFCDATEKPIHEGEYAGTWYSESAVRDNFDLDIPYDFSDLWNPFDKRPQKPVTEDAPEAFDGQAPNHPAEEQPILSLVSGGGFE